jgi:GntR family transcriptional repressor for pyruvate dehydrogenase complex
MRLTESTYRPGYEAVADKIVEYITSSGLQPGDRLPTEHNLGKLLGVSRAMIREAVKLLTARGYVWTRRGSGIYVASEDPSRATAAIDLSMLVDHEHMQALFEFRCMQEILTAQLATERITLAELRVLEEAVTLNRYGAEAGRWDIFIESDIAFHQGVAQASHNFFLMETVATTFRLQRRAIKIITGGSPGSMLVSADQHAAILAAIRSGRPDAAAKAMQMHIEAVTSDYQNEIRRLLLEHAEDRLE